MHLGSKNISAADETCGSKVMRREVLPVIGGRRGGKGGGGDQPGRHVITEYLGAIEINNGPVVALEASSQVGNRTGVGDIEGASKIIGDKAGGIGGGLATVAETERGWTRAPGRIIKDARAPGRSLIGAVIQILPDGAGWN